MAVLATISTTRDVVWKDTTGVVWKSTAAVTWKDLADDSTLHLSLDGSALERYWDDMFIESFSSSSYNIATPYGGYIELDFGQLILSPDAFATNWPPPKMLNIYIEFTDSNEASAVPLFNGEIYLVSYDIDSVTYNMFAPKYAQRLLNEGSDYNGDTVPYPRAFGTVTHQQPLRLEDEDNPTAFPALTGCPTYHLAGLATTAQARTVQSFDSASAGAKTKVTVDSAHGWINGTSITITCSVNFNGMHTIESVSGTTFVIPVAFPTGNSETLPIHANAYYETDFCVYDDGVPIQENVGINGDGTFSLDASPVGVITVSGTAAYTDLEELMTWGYAHIGLSSIDTTYTRSPSPSVSIWATAQMPAIDFMSDVCAFFTHYFYVKGSILYLGDMLANASAATLTEFDYFDISYKSHDAIRQLKSSWTTHVAAEDFVDEVVTARYIKDIENTVVVSLYTVASGTASTTQSMKLVDSTATFLSDGVIAGHVVQNTTDNTSSIVNSVSETALELEDDIFVASEAYVVGPSFPYGKDEEIEPFHDTKSNVTTALQNILSVLTKDVVEIRIPLSDSLPSPGDKITLSDTQMVADTSAWFRIRNITYDIAGEEVVLSGEGVIS
jgi:hypothetical protein